jgi:hypothetical protein
VTVVNAAEIRFSPFMRWQRSAAVNPGYVYSDGDLPPEHEARIRQAERAAMVGPRQRRRVREIDPAWIHPPLRFCRRGDELPRLEISAPTIVGDIAFVSAAFDCVLCGQGIVFVLERRDRRWEIVANAQPWVS